MADSIRFDRIADRYDDTRGGLERGRRVAADLSPNLSAGTVLEVGIGTGLVAAGLRELGHSVVGVDLSRPMLELARRRLGPVVALADADALPTGDRAVANVVFVHVLHLVGDMRAAISEASRVLAPRGRLIAVHAGPRTTPDELTRVTEALAPLRDRWVDTPAAVAAAAADVGLSVVAMSEATEQHTSHSPRALADLIETKTFSYLWQVAPAEWSSTVEPVIAALRALPEPDRARPQVSWMRLSVFQK